MKPATATEGGEPPTTASPTGGAGARFRPAWPAALVVGTALAIPLLWCFGPALLTARSFVFRDAAHYYYPLFQWTAHEWAEGRVPLWNPQENCGTPVLADATSSVFYPGKLLFALPGTYATKYKWYIVGHVLLAAATAFGLARRWECSTLASGFGALAYAFGGSVLFQYCNVVYLVGAAWLPLAVLAADRMLRVPGDRHGVARLAHGHTLARRASEGPVRTFLACASGWCKTGYRQHPGGVAWAVALGGVLALMTLGGDPQAAYHAGALAVLYALVLRRDGRAGKKTGGEPGPEAPAQAKPDAGGGGRRRLALLGVAAASGLLLSAIQVLPSVEWTRRSQRAVYESPRTVYEIPWFTAHETTVPRAADAARGLFALPAEGTHHEHAYLFSVGPWRVAELLWPNFYGRQFPIHRRWSMAIRDESACWTPSLYVGLLPFVLALAVWRLRGGEPRVRWMSWCVVLGLLGSFGWYGLGWLVRAVGISWAPAALGDDGLGPPVGGLYWLLVTLVPGYVYFRYPAKLMVIAALGLSLLAARGFDAVLLAEGKRLRRVLAGLSVASLILLAGTAAIAPCWTDWLGGVDPDTLFGPLDARGALRELRGSLWHGAVLAAIGSGLLAWGQGAWRPKFIRATDPRAHLNRRAWCGGGLLLMTAVDLAVAHGWTVPTAPQQAVAEPSYFAEQIAAKEARRADSAQPFRVYRDPADHWAPNAWRVTASRDRHREGLAWDRDTLFPKHHLRQGLSLIESRGSLSSADYEAVLRSPEREVSDALGAKYLLLPDGVTFPGTEGVAEPSGRQPPSNARLQFNPQAFPRAWIVHQADLIPCYTGTNPRRLDELTRTVVSPGGQPRDLRRGAVVEETETGAKFAWDDGDGSHREEPGAAARSPALPDEFCRVVVDEPQRVVVEAQLHERGLVVISDMYYPGWTAEVVSAGQVSPQPVPIWRTNRVMRGVLLPPGTHRLTYAYRPTSFYAGAAISGLSCLALLAAAIVWWRKASP